MRRQQRSHVRGANSLISRCGEILIRGDNQTIAKGYETLTKNAESEMEAENYRQHAEHYRREHCGQRA